MLRPTKKLGEICEKSSLARAPINSWPYIEISDVDIENKSIIFKEKKSVEGAVIAPRDSVIVSRVRPTRGAITLLEQKQIISSAFAILKTKNSEALPKFLFYSIGWSKEFLAYLQKKQKGSNYPSVREKDILNFKILLPPHNIQYKIVERLDAIRKAQELNDKQITLADELFQSLLQKQLNPKGKSWEARKFGEILSVLTDYHANGSYKMLREHVELKVKPDYAYMVRTSDLEKNDFINDVRYISKEAYGFLKKTQIFGGEILINKIGSAGNIYLMPYLSKQASLGMNLFLLRVNDQVSDNLFAHYFLSTRWGKSQLLNRVQGAVTKTITKESIRSVKIPLPPLATQRQIVAKLQTIQDYKKKLLEQKQKLQELFNSCLDKTMKGKLIN